MRPLKNREQPAQPAQPTQPASPVTGPGDSQPAQPTQPARPTHPVRVPAGNQVARPVITPAGNQVARPVITPAGNQVARPVIGLAGSRVAQLARIAGELRSILGVPPEQLLSVYDFTSGPLPTGPLPAGPLPISSMPARPLPTGPIPARSTPTGLANAERLAADSPSQYDAGHFLEALSRLRQHKPDTQLHADRTTRAASPVLTILGPLATLPAIRQACDLLIFVHVDEGLAMLRWADDLLQAGAPGGIEALDLYSRLVAPAYQRWSSYAMQSADLVLDDEEGPLVLADKIAYLYSQRLTAARSSAAGSTAATTGSGFGGSAAGSTAGSTAATTGSGFGGSAAGSTAATTGHTTPGKSPGTAQGRRILSAADRRSKLQADKRSRLQAARALESRLRRSSLPARLRAGLRTVEANVIYPAAKRSLDILVVSLVLLVAWPILALVAVLVWLDDPGPVLYVQTRVGRFGRIFKFPKFRSMIRDADKLKDKLLALNEMQGGITFKMKRDPRVLPIGRVMRKYSLDELPQLWSVLRGDLTLVGPRPPVPREVALYSSMDRRRLEAVPGLTCIWQVSGRSDIPFPRQVELDVEYLEQRSLSLDLRLLLATVPAVITGKGAY